MSHLYMGYICTNYRFETILLANKYFDKAFEINSKTQEIDDLDMLIRENYIVTSFNKIGDESISDNYFIQLEKFYVSIGGKKDNLINFFKIADTFNISEFFEISISELQKNIIFEREKHFKEIDFEVKKYWNENASLKQKLIERKEYLNKLVATIQSKLNNIYEELSWTKIDNIIDYPDAEISLQESYLMMLDLQYKFNKTPFFNLPGIISIYLQKKKLDCKIIALERNSFVTRYVVNEELDKSNLYHKFKKEKIRLEDKLTKCNKILDKIDSYIAFPLDADSKFDFFQSIQGEDLSL